MIEERINLANEEANYHAFHLSEHFLRYKAISAICTGKKILDFSCGEGYGSHILANAGAESVTGVDISAAAVARAQSLFGSDKVRFICTAAESITNTFRDEQFDAIVSMETIEHVADPVGMLRAIKKMLKQDGMIILSCPNDLAHPEINNQYHLRKYTFSEFKSMAENILGTASSAYIGTPVHGHAIINAGDTPTAGTRALDILNSSQLTGTTWLSPSQQNILPTTASCSYYILIWNGKINTPSTCISYQSLSGAIDPWFQLETLSLENKRLTDIEIGSIRLKDQFNILQEENMRLGIALIAERERNLQNNSSAVISAHFSKWGRRQKKWANSIKKRLSILK